MKRLEASPTAPTTIRRPLRSAGAKLDYFDPNAGTLDPLRHQALAGAHRSLINLIEARHEDGAPVSRAVSIKRVVLKLDRAWPPSRPSAFPGPN